MSAPPYSAFEPPLPPGWTQHLGPGGQIYYFNAQSQQSTYVRPVPQFVPVVPVSQQPKKKEKANIKTAVPGTDWLRVTTTEGNVFYSNKTTKQSSWTVPSEIAGAVEAFDREIRQRSELPLTGKSQPAQSTAAIEHESKDNSKRKADESIPVDEVVVSKKVKVDEGDHADEDESSEEEEEEEEEWQREAAEQLAREAEEEKQRIKEEERRVRETESLAAEQAASAQLNMPEKVDLSVEEAKALFKTLLREKDINPLHPWDTCLPKFISDPRYVLLPSVSSRREAFDEYCRDRARELRQCAVKKEKQEANPKEEYEHLLKEEVTSTRASWTEFRRAWKKDRRFYAWGRDDRDREKKFREFLKQLSEQKRAAAQKAEADFFALLKKHPEIKAGSVWKEVKRALHNDPRYDAVGSSTLREELFNTYLKGAVSNTEEPIVDDIEVDGEGTGEQESRQNRKERAIREREQKVKVEKGRLDAQIEKSRIGVNKEEGERLFKTMLIDAIRDPQVSWDSALPQLKTDPRFTNSPLSHNHQIQLFHSHITHLRSKHFDTLHSLFDKHAPSLASPFNALALETVLLSTPVTKLGYDVNRLEQEFDRWQRERNTNARREFDEMLNENSFVEFWGRLSKIGDVALGNGLQISGEDIGEADDEGGNKVDMKALAKNVDIREMDKVLKRDRRYTVFDHVPEKREQWLRDYLSNLAAPKLSVHLPPS